MAGAGGGVNMEQFEAYFRRADLDQDGKISGAEAVSFLQGSNLPKQVLAQIWMHADQSHTGYLSRPEFYNFLKLVTVAQSKRELTPDIVKAALYGPASSKIPAPKINLAATPAPQLNSASAAPPLQVGVAAPASSNNIGFRGLTPSSTSINQHFGQVQSTTGVNQQFGQAPPSSGMNQQFRPAPSSSGVNQQFRQVPPNTNMNQQFGQPILSTSTNQQYFSSQGNQPTRPLPMPAATASRPSPGPGGLNFPSGGDMVGPGLRNSNNDTLGGRTSVAPTGPTPVTNRGASPSIPPVAPKLLDPLSTMSSTAAKDPKALAGSGNGFATESMFGGDVFSTTQSPSLQVSSAPTRPSSGIPTPSAIVPVSTGPQPSAKPDPFEAFPNTLMKPSTMSQAQQSSSLSKSNQQASTQVTSFGSSFGAPAGGGNSAAEQSQISWPKMTRASVQKYAKVFVEVDTDRDGKITGEQAHSLFLSWRLPIEVLKQVWDLSDQDSDGMLSLREFCIALYLMERYREGRPLPSALPSSIMLDETLLSLAGPPTASYGSAGWGPTTDIRPQQLPHGAQPIASTGLRPLTQTVYSQPDRSMQFINEQNARSPLMDNSYTSEIGNGEENSLDNVVQEEESSEKVENKEKVLLDSREKIEFYRTKMQDLVLYKSRCDNRLNEITERALADKREAELLAKKYEEKYKQVAEIASKLTIEEASFREIQERKMELHQAIIKMEQGGSADGILQVRADRIQSDLEELLKAMAERCKKHDLQIKSTALIELPPGWQPGIPEFVSIWDEDWDKFEDEGFSFDVAVSANAKSTSVHEENSSPTHNFPPDYVSNPDAPSEKPFSKGASAFKTELSYAHSEDESKSPQGSPARQASFESPSPKSSENHFRKSSDGDNETHRSFDEPAWGTFDNNDDIDSVWGFNAKDSDHGKHEEKYFFGSSDFGASPERTDSPQKNSPFTFENSVPGSPLSRAGNSPPRSSVESRDPFFDSFSRYDSFHTQDHVPSPRRETLTRFDSMNSTRDFDHSGGFSFDDSDPFGSSGPFKVSSESQTPKKGSESWGSF